MANTKAAKMLQTMEKSMKEEIEKFKVVQKGKLLALRLKWCALFG